MDKQATPIDIEEAKRHLHALGITDEMPVIFCAYGQTNRFFPDRVPFSLKARGACPGRRRQLPYNWAAFEKRQAERVAEAKTASGLPWSRSCGTPQPGTWGLLATGRHHHQGPWREITTMRFLTTRWTSAGTGQSPALDQRSSGSGRDARAIANGEHRRQLAAYLWLLTAVRWFRAKSRENGCSGINANELVVDFSMASGHQQRLAGYIHPKTGDGR